jgi:Mrp family chromosome partitioning ATPase
LSASTQKTVEITVRHPDGSITLAAPADVPIGELMADVLDVTGQPDRNDWVLSPDGANAYPGDRTLAELEVDGATLILHEQTPAALSATIEETQPADPAPARSAHAGRPLSELTARMLPAKLSRPARTWLAVRALASISPRAVRLEPPAPGIPGPASFTRATRISPLERICEAWTSAGYEHRLDQLVLDVRLRRCATIAVISPKGGVGKTTVTALIGSLLAFLRRDRVVAVETNPDWGSLGRRLVPEHTIFIDDLLQGPLADGPFSPTQLDAQLGRGPDGLMVAPAPTDPTRAQKLDEAAYRTLFARLSELVGTLVLDCGTGLDDPPARAALACADQLVLVCDDEPDTASIVSEAAECWRGSNRRWCWWSTTSGARRGSRSPRSSGR